MDNQHKLIKGYRELGQDEIDLMNEIKTKAADVQELIAKVQAHVNTQYDSVFDDSNYAENSQEELRLDAADPYTWAQEAKHSFQTAFMKLVRSVAQPTTF